MWQVLAGVFGIVLIIMMVLAILLYIQENEADEFKRMDIDKLYKKVNKNKKKEKKKNGK